MTNNQILRRLRYTFDMSDAAVIETCASADYAVSRQQVSWWLKKDDDPQLLNIEDVELASFLNGFINEKRGKREGPQPKPEQTLTNNIILRKLKIALNLKNEDILAILKLADLNVSPHELSALFRKPGQRQYRSCKDQFLRNFLSGLQIKYRP